MQGLTCIFASKNNIKFVTAMKHIDLKEFRKYNRLNQQELADYLGVSRGFISLVETNASKLPQSKLAMILANTEWDTSMLDNNGHTVLANATDNSDIKVNINANDEKLKSENMRLLERIASLKETIDSLKQQLEEEKKRTETAIREKEEYWKMIQKLVK